MVKIKLFNAQHYHDKGAKATWLKSESFDSDIFEKLKSLKSSLNNKSNKYTVVNGKVLYLFYASAKESLGNRESNPISAFISEIDSPYSDKIYNAIDEQIKNKFDNSQREYIINIDEDVLIKKKSFNLYLGIVIVFMILFSFIYFAFNKEETESKQIVLNNVAKHIEKSKILQKEKTEEKKIHTTTKVEKIIKEDIIQKITRPQIPTWKWRSFCKKYQKNAKLDGLVLDYMQVKCTQKEKFNDSFKEYLDGNDVDVKSLLHSFKRREKQFFGEEL